MIYGSIAFFLYACAASFVLMRHKPHALTTTLTLLPVWFVAFFGLLFLLSKGA